MKRLLITGSRVWSDEAAMAAALSEARLELGEDAILVHGGAEGADTMAARLWIEEGGATEEHKPNYSDKTLRPRYIPMARNTRMVLAGADLCLAFLAKDPRTGKTSRGTYDCIGKCREAGIPVRIINQPAKARRQAGEIVKIEVVE